MNEKDSAFPFYSEHKCDSTTEYGLTKRELLAAMMLSGSLAGVHSHIPKGGRPATTTDAHTLVRQSIQYADELIRQLANSP